MTEESLRAFDSLTLSQEDNRGWCVKRWGFLSDFVAIEMTGGIYFMPWPKYFSFSVTLSIFPEEVLGSSSRWI